LKAVLCIIVRMKSNFIKAFISSVVLISVVILNCGFKEVPLTKQENGSVSSKGVTIEAKVMSRAESNQTLGRALQKWEIIPVQVKIQNNTKESYSLSADGVDLPHVTSGDVAMSVTSSSIPRSIALKVAGFLFWPFIIPSMIDSIITFKSHVDMRSDFYARSIKAEGEDILPYSTVERVLFVPKGKWADEFTLQLHDLHSNKNTPFSITMNS